MRMDFPLTFPVSCLIGMISVEAVESVKKQGKICILDIDVQGVSNVKTSSLESKYIFIAPPSMDVLEKRLRGRGTEKEEDITKRLSNAAKEMEYGEEDGNFDGVFVNDNLVETFSKIKKEFKEWYPHLVECTKKKPEEVTSSEIDNDADKSVSETTSLNTVVEKGISKKCFHPYSIVFAGPSGVGKSVLMEMLVKHIGKDTIDLCVSHTTRSPRNGEIDGHHHHFISNHDFKNMSQNGEFVDYWRVKNASYGIRCVFHYLVFFFQISISILFNFFF